MNKQKDIKTSNFIIAKFMGYQLITPSMRSNPEFWRYSYWEHETDSEKYPPVIEDGLKYHLSWDWLIPVIDKIYSSDDYVEYKKSLNQFSDGIFINTKYIDSTYNQVVDYLKWYNSYKTVLQEQNKNKQ